MALWTALLALAVARWEVMMEGGEGGAGWWGAVATLVAALGALWWWSFRAAGPAPGREPELSPDAPAPGSRGAWGALGRNPLAVIGLVVVVGAYLAAALAPLLAPGDPSYQGAYVGGELALRLAPPSAGHPLGTDSLGRDVLSRLLFGARISLSVGLLAVAISVCSGTLLGTVAGYAGGVVDSVIMRFADAVMAFPKIVLLVVMAALFRPSVGLVVVALALTLWPEAARMVRGEMLILRQREFAEAARALGFSRRRIVLRHLLPNALGPVIVMATLGIGNAIVLEAGLSFLGLGVQPPTPSWGSMVADGMGSMVEGAWWAATFPGLAIVFVVLAVNLVGDGLRDALDPRGRWRALR